MATNGAPVDQILVDALAKATTVSQMRAAWVAYRDRAWPVAPTPAPVPTPPPTPPPPTPPPTVSQPNATNTGPSGVLTAYTGPLWITTPGTLIQNVLITIGDGDTFAVKADNVKIVNSTIRYVGMSTLADARFNYLNAHGLVLDHVELDFNHRSEYGLRAFSDFTMTVCKVHGASHVIDAFGDPATHAPTLIQGSYIYDSDDKPYATDGTQYQGHSCALYFSGCNSPVTVKGNTIVTPQQYPAGHSVNATAACAIYPLEGQLAAQGSYTYDGNWISGGGHVLTARSDGKAGTIPSLRFTNNILTSQWGGPGVAAYGPYDVPDGVAVQRVFSGNSYGVDVVGAGSLPAP